MSVTSVIMLVFQHSSSVTHHCQIMECLMALKPKVVSDVLCVIAHGTSSARASAAKLLFYYWPPFNNNVFEKKTVLPKYACKYCESEKKETIGFSLQRIGHRLYVRETCARMSATQKLQKSAMITVFRSHFRRTVRRLCIYALSAQMKFIANIPIRCSMIFCILCNKHLFNAKIR